MTDRGNINRQIEISNRKLRQVEERINELQGWLEEERAMPELQPQITTQSKTQSSISELQSPTFADIIANILSQQGQAISKSHSSRQI